MNNLFDFFFAEEDQRVTELNWSYQELEWHPIYQSFTSCGSKGNSDLGFADHNTISQGRNQAKAQRVARPGGE